MTLAMDLPASNEWHILKGETQYGPYSYEEVLRMMQNNIVYSFDYLWSPEMEAWSPAADLQEFSSDRIARVLEQNPINGVFIQREQQRVRCLIPIFAHNQNKMWEGAVESLSQGGALLLIKNPTLLPGEMIQLHFRNHAQGKVAFNCQAEIIGKRLVKKRIQHDTAIHYAVRFVNKSPVAEQQINKTVSELLTQKKGA